MSFKEYLKYRLDKLRRIPGLLYLIAIIGIGLGYIVEWMFAIAASYLACLLIAEIIRADYQNWLASRKNKAKIREVSSSG